MEIDLAVIRCLEETITFFRENASNAPNRRQLVRLHVAPELAKMILDATPGGIEGISNRDGQIVCRLVIDGNLGSGHAKIDPHVERPSFAVVMNRRLDHHVASGKPWEVELKILGTLSDLRLHGGGQLKITRGNLNGSLHLISPSQGQNFWIHTEARIRCANTKRSTAPPWNSTWAVTPSSFSRYLLRECR
jgi:hypothetical protein